MAVFYFNDLRLPVTTEPDLLAALTTVTDQLLERVSALTATLAGDGSRVDPVAARALLADLSLVAGAWQTLGTSASQRLDAAKAELDEAARAIDRVMAQDDPA